MTAVIRAKTWAEGRASNKVISTTTTARLPNRQPESWVKVMGRLTDSTKRARIARNFEKDHGHPMEDPDAMNMYVAFSVDHLGIQEAMDRANAYIEDHKAMYGSTFEFQLAGGRW